jgi:hypothetical protein
MPSLAGALTCVIAMPYFYFDLVIGNNYRDQGAMILENEALAAERTDSLASELAIIRPEMKITGWSIRVVDEDDREIYRAPLDPVPTWQNVRQRA